jgi:DnaJ-domain-containing protein 1
MPRRRRKAQLQDAFDAIAGFCDLVNETFEKLTGKPIAAWLREFQQQPRELPVGEQAAGQQPTMPLADAYAIMGMKPNSSFDEVKKRYRVLANLFHPDAPGGYEEAMKLLNNAYEQIMKGKGGN